jgi:hypothetical protein
MPEEVALEPRAYRDLDRTELCAGKDDVHDLDAVCSDYCDPIPSAYPASGQRSGHSIGALIDIAVRVPLVPEAHERRRGRLIGSLSQ